MKRTLSIISLVLCVLLLCTACSGGMTFAEYHKNTKFEDPYSTLNSMEKISSLSKMSHSQTYGEILVLEDEQNVKFYNIDTNQIIVQVPAEKFQGVTFFDVYGYTFFAVAEGDCGFGMILFPEELLIEGNIDTTIQVTIYDAAGTAVADSKEKWIQSCDDVTGTVEAKADLIKFGSKIYRVAVDGTVSEILDNPFFGKLPTVDAYTAEYYYDLNGDSAYVYDKSLNCIYIWQLPHEDADEASITLLAGNRLLVQYTLPLPVSEDKYDLLIDEEKYLLESLIIDMKSLQAKSVELDYVLTYAAVAKDALVSWDYERSENKKVDTFAIVSMIEDSRLTSLPRYVSINSSTGKVEFEIFTDLQGTASLIAEGLYRYTTYNGDIYLMNSEGKIISKINDFSSSKQNNAFIAASGKIYNYNLECVFDYSEQKLEINRMMAHSILFTDRKETVTLLTADGEVKNLALEAPTIALSRNQFFVLQTGGSFCVFAEDGSMLGSSLTVDSVSVLTVGINNAILQVTTAEGNYEYYRLFVAPVEEAK